MAINTRLAVHLLAKTQGNILKLFTHNYTLGKYYNNSTALAFMKTTAVTMNTLRIDDTTNKPWRHHTTHDVTVQQHMMSP